MNSSVEDIDTDIEMSKIIRLVGKSEQRHTGKKYRQLNRSQCNGTQWKKKKAITSNVSTSTKWYRAMILPGDVEGWAEGRRLIGKCFLRAVTAEQGLKEVMGMNWLRGAGRKFRIQRMAPSEDERRNQAVCREGTMGRFASSWKTRWKLTRHPSGEVWRGNIVKAVGSGSLQRTLNANHALWKNQTLKYNFVTGLSFLNLTNSWISSAQPPVVKIIWKYVFLSPSPSLLNSLFVDLYRENRVPDGYLFLAKILHNSLKYYSS